METFLQFGAVQEAVCCCTVTSDLLCASMSEQRANPSKQCIRVIE